MGGLVGCLKNDPAPASSLNARTKQHRKPNARRGVAPSAASDPEEKAKNAGENETRSGT